MAALQSSKSVGKKKNMGLIYMPLSGGIEDLPISASCRLWPAGTPLLLFCYVHALFKCILCSLLPAARKK